MTFTGLEDKAKKPIRVPYEPECLRCGHPKRSHINMLGRSVSLGSIFCLGYKAPSLPATDIFDTIDALAEDERAKGNAHAQPLIEDLKTRLRAIIEKHKRAQPAQEDKNAESAKAAEDVQKANEAANAQPKIINIDAKPAPENPDNG